MMTELSRYIGPDVDVPAGDIGVGGREIGFLFGQYKRMAGEHSGVLTGKGYGWGGSLIRPEATGYGAVYALKCCVDEQGKSMEGELKSGQMNNTSPQGLRVLLSGSGNVAQFAAEKCLHFGAKVISFSDSNGTIIEPNGFTREQVDQVVAIKTARGRCSEYKSDTG